MSVGYSPADVLRIWAVSDGRAGIENQALGLAEAIARRVRADVITKRIQLRTPWSWLHPGFIPAPKQALAIGSDAIDPPYPDIFIGCGRTSIPFAMSMREWSRNRTLVVQLQDPRINPREFDLVVPPFHDGLGGPNVVGIVGACHRVTPQRIAEEAGPLRDRLLAETHPIYAVLIGGKSKRQTITARRARLMSDALARVKHASGGTLAVTLSRRTPKAARAAFAAHLAPHAALFYDPADGVGANPYFALLSAADAIFVTADSVNMATEAAATGKPIHVMPVDGGSGKLAAFHQSLEERGAARPFRLPLTSWAYTPLLETDRAAQAVLMALQARRQKAQ
ncbi:MAG: nucleoside-diphosphate sugar epimerase [Alphaproteobacteria bacterium]|nr:nucleoside-diphosphate sugar epimerase [Alphaproteobacteria bacterium]